MTAEAETLRLRTGPEGGGFDRLGGEIVAALDGRPAGPVLQTVDSGGTVTNLEAVQAGEADVALTFADVAYMAYSGGLQSSAEPMDRLRGIAVLPVTPLALVTRAGLVIDSPDGLRGRVVAVGPSRSGTALTARLVLEAFGLDESTVDIRTTGFRDASAGLESGTIDAMFGHIVNESAWLTRVLDGGASLVPLEGRPVDRLRNAYPFLRPTSVSRRVHSSIERSRHTVGVDGLLVARRDLSDDVVYRLVAGFFDVLPELSLMGQVDLDLAPATPIPLHPGAARYYRERELLR